MLTFKHISALMVAAAIASTPALASLKITAQVDSSQIEMGRIAAVKIETVEPASSPAQLLINEGAFPQAVEVRGWAESADTTDIGNGLRQIRRALIIQSFDSGLYTLPPFLLVSGRDTVASKAITLKVNPVDVSAMTDINPIADVQPFKTRWYDFLPDWLTDYWQWYLLGLLVIAGAVCAVLIARGKVKVPMPQRKRLPADVIAIKRLDALRDDHLWESGQDKEYYTRLVDILRDYLQERFGINAMEMTTTQILKALHDNAETSLPRRYMQRVVEIADYVKFAKVRPLPDDNVGAMRDAYAFVEETRPVTAPEVPDGATVTIHQGAPAAPAPESKTPENK